MRSHDLSVVIPTRERWDILKLTLTSLNAQTEPGFETIVVVDGDDQQVPSLPGVQVVQQSQAGPGAARNHGVSLSSRPLILFLNDDMVPRPQLIEHHLAQHQAEPAENVGVLGRVVWHPSVRRDRLHNWLEWSSALFDYSLIESQGEDDIGWTRFYSCNVSLKREFFLASGGFDPDFVFDYEDLDLGWRLGQRRLRLIYERHAVVEHLHPYDWPAVERRYESRAAAERLMMAKHDWFQPWFHGQLEAAEREPEASRVWALAVDRVPKRATRLRRAVERRADLHYRQRLAPAFFSAWERSRDSETGAEDP